MSEMYVLRDRVAVEEPDVEAWGRWLQSADRRVAETVVGAVRVSTVFLGLDHSFGWRPPLLFETVVFGGPLDETQDRYTTWDEAERGHAAMVHLVEVRGQAGG